MTDKLELKSCHEVIDTVDVEDVDSIFHGKPTDPDILTVLMKDGKRLYCDEVCPIDSLQEEAAPKIFEDMLNAKTPAESLGISAEEHENIIDLCIYGKEPEMVGIDDLHKEEPVSEDLDIFASEYVRDPDNWVDWIGPHGETDDISYIIKAIKAGAQWQFNQLEKNRLAACDRASKEDIEREQDFCDKIIIGEHRQPTYSDAIEYGINWQKEKMMSKAVETTFNVSLPSGLYDKLCIKGCKEGDKLLVIKKDEL